MRWAPLWPAGLAVAVVVALAILCWGLGRRTRGDDRWARVACLLALLSWLGLVLRPELPLAGGESRIIVRTAGAGEMSRQAEPEWEAPVVELGAARARHGAPDLAWLLRRHPGLRELVVMGHGLDPWSFEGFSGRLVTGPDEPLPRGFAAVHWQRRLGLGSQLVVRGRWEAPGGAADASQIELVTPEGTVTAVRPESSGRFALRVVPATRGAGLYTLRARREGRLEAEELLDVGVEEPRAPRLLWLEASPSFESRHLEAWYQDLGGALGIRSQLAPGVFRRVERGVALPADAALRSEDLRRFDLLAVDTRTLRSLPAASRTELRRAVRDGLGLLLRVEEEVETLAPDGQLVGGFVLDRSAAEAGEAAAGDWAPRLLLPALPAPGLAEPLELTRRELAPGEGVRPLIVDRAGRLFAASRPLGSGVVAVTLVDRTYRWRLVGEDSAYEAYWSRLLSEVARRAPAEPSIELPEGPVWIDRPLEVTLWSAAEAPSLFLRESQSGLSVRLALRQSRALAARWSATAWPRGVGWHRLEAEVGAAPVHLDFYASPTGAWRTSLAAARKEATRRRALDPGAPAVVPPADLQRARVWRRIPRWVFFALWMGALGLLWTRRGRSPAAADLTRGLPR